MTTDGSSTKSESAPKAADKAAASAPSEATANSEGNAPSKYIRGEKQKPVTNSYKDNWNTIFGKKKKTKRSRSR